MQTNENYTIDQAKKPDCFSVDYSKTTIQDFLRSQSSHTAAFVQTKLALAAEMMAKSGYTYDKIAKTLGLASGPAIHMLIKNWGSEARKRGGLK